MTHTTHSWRYVLTAALAASLALPAAAAAQAMSATAPAVSPAPDYRLVPGDKLRIEVYKDTQLSQSAQIRPDGKITLPLIGDLAAASQTPAQLRDTITTALKEYVNNPSVTVIVVETVAPTAYVMGEVRAPGAVTLDRSMTVLQALALAGGLTEFANEKNIRVLRKTADGGVETLPFHYKDALKGEAKAQLVLQAGDTVVVP